MEEMKTSSKGLQLIRSYEGCVLTAYKCPAGVWTIGYGHTRGVKRGDKISKSLAEEFLMADIKPIERQLNNTFPWLKQNEFDALVSFIFNLGYYAFESSTLFKRVLAKASGEMVCEQLLRWFYVGKKPLVGLMRRRVAEANMWMGMQAYSVMMVDGHAKIVKI